MCLYVCQHGLESLYAILCCRSFTTIIERVSYFHVLAHIAYDGADNEAFTSGYTEQVGRGAAARHGCNERSGANWSASTPTC